MNASLASLQERLQNLNESIQQTTNLIQRLSTLQPQLRTSDPTRLPDAESSLETVTDLSAEIHDVLKQQEEDLALLRQDVDDETAPRGFGLGSRRSGTGRQEGDRGRFGNSLAEGCESLTEELKNTRTRFRNAQLQAKRNADAARQQERVDYLASLQAAAEAMNAAAEEAAAAAAAEQETSSHAQTLTPHPALSTADARKLLLSRRSPRPGTPRDPNATQADLALSATSNITSSLRRTHALLTSELSRSQFAQETFDSSNAALEELNSRYSNLDDLLAKSRGLLGSLLRSQKSDTWYLETALYLLAGTIAWLVFRRLLYGPLWWFVWFPTRLFFRIFSSITGFVLSVITGTVGGMYSLVAGGKASSGIVVTTTLRIMPSAIGKPPSRSASVVGGAYIPAGAGGGGAKGVDVRGGRSPPGSMSDLVGRMAEAASVAGFSSSGNFDTEMPLATEMAEAASVAGLGRYNTDVASLPMATPTQPSQHQHDQEGEQSAQERQAEQQLHVGERQAQAQEVVRRADGQVLRERDPVREPPNPKKRMFEEPPAPAPARSTKAFETPEMRGEL